MRFQSLPQWLDWLETLHPVTIDLGLERVALVAAQLNVLQHSATVITVAGSNGKGSAIAALFALIMANDSQSAPLIGVYTSPHLCNFNERIAINGKPCSDQVLCRALAKVDDALQAVSQRNTKPLSLTYFEFTTLAALVIFQEHGLDYWLLEVGLGGRLDAVNIIDPDIAVITSIALDHQSWLGETREQIAKEKAAIARRQKPAITGDDQPPITLNQTLTAIGANPVYAYATATAPGGVKNQHGFFSSGSALRWQGGRASGDAISCDNLPQPALPIASWSCALQASVLLFDTLPAQATLASLLNDTRLLGRGSSIMHQQREFVLDVAHNPQAIGHLTARLLQQQPEKHCTCIFALLDDKPLDTIVDQLSGVVKSWVLPALKDCSRAIAPREIEKSIQQRGAEAAKTNAFKNTCTNITASVAEAIDWAIHTTTVSDRIIVCGSFYLVGEVLNILDPET